MTLWKAITYHLFAGLGNPKASAITRGVAYVVGLGAIACLVYRFTPHLGVTYPLAYMLATTYVLCMLGGSVIGLLSDSVQRTFLMKLQVFNRLPLPVRSMRIMYLYASLPVAGIAIVSITAALASAFNGVLPTPYVWLLCSACAIMAVFGDVILRIASVPWLLAFGVRVAHVGIAVYLGQALFLTAGHSSYIAWAALYAAIQAVVVVWLVGRPLTVEYERMRIPVRQGLLTQSSAVGVRAIRTSRYIGTNILFVFAIVCVTVSARSRSPFIPLDGALMGMLLLVGTLGQEVRTLSRTHYPVDLTLYATLRTWLTSAWLLAFVNALLWIDLCMAIVLFMAPHGRLSISVLQAGCMGLVFVAAGIAAGSTAIPQKRDIFAQCISTAVYGLLIWGIIKMLALPFFVHLHPFIWALPLLSACLWWSYALEKMRWHKDIKGDCHDAAI